MGNQSNSKPQSAGGRDAARHLAIVKARNKRIILLTVSLCLLLVLAAGIITGLHLLTRQPKDDGLILDNVIVGGVNIGGIHMDQPTRNHQLADVGTLGTLRKHRSDINADMSGGNDLLFHSSVSFVSFIREIHLYIIINFPPDFVNEFDNFHKNCYSGKKTVGRFCHENIGT